MSNREKIRQPPRKSARLEKIQYRENQHQDQTAPLNQAAPLQPARPQSGDQHPLSEANLRAHTESLEIAGKRKRKQPTNTEEVTASDTSSASMNSRQESLVKEPTYRRTYLGANNIYMRDPYEKFPEHIINLVDHIAKDRHSPGPSPDQVRQDTSLHGLAMGSAKSAVENYFKANVFPNPKLSDSLNRIDESPMAKHTVPSVALKPKVSTPVPDMLYGYNSISAFPQQQALLVSIGNEMVANAQDLMYPFFVIEFKADGPGGSGSMWVATNQCLGGSASCVNIAERLNRRLKQCKSSEVQLINSAAFSIAMNGTEARLYISWKHNELDYYMQNVDNFLLQRPRDYIEFRKHVRNIIDWGKDERLKEILVSLDSLNKGRRNTSTEIPNTDPSTEL